MKIRIWMDDDELWYVSVLDKSIWRPINYNSGCYTKWGAKRLAKRYKKVHARAEKSEEYFDI